jgi:hypothetical protein
MRRRDLLREIGEIQAAFDRAPLNWRYRGARSDLVNVSDRAGYVLKAAARLVELLPEIVSALSSRKVR